MYLVFKKNCIYILENKLLQYSSENYKIIQIFTNPSFQFQYNYNQSQALLQLIVLICPNIEINTHNKLFSQKK